MKKRAGRIARKQVTATSLFCVIVCIGVIVGIGTPAKSGVGGQTINIAFIDYPVESLESEDGRRILEILNGSMPFLIEKQLNESGIYAWIERLGTMEHIRRRDDRNSSDLRDLANDFDLVLAFQIEDVDYAHRIMLELLDLRAASVLSGDVNGVVDEIFIGKDGDFDAIENKLAQLAEKMSRRVESGRTTVRGLARGADDGNRRVLFQCFHAADPTDFQMTSLGRRLGLELPSFVSDEAVAQEAPVQVEGLSWYLYEDVCNRLREPMFSAESSRRLYLISRQYDLVIRGELARRGKSYLVNFISINYENEPGLAFRLYSEAFAAELIQKDQFMQDMAKHLLEVLPAQSE